MLVKDAVLSRVLLSLAIFLAPVWEAAQASSELRASDEVFIFPSKTLSLFEAVDDSSPIREQLNRRFLEAKSNLLLEDLIARVELWDEDYRSAFFGMESGFRDRLSLWWNAESASIELKALVLFVSAEQNLLTAQTPQDYYTQLLPRLCVSVTDFLELIQTNPEFYILQFQQLMEKFTRFRPTQREALRRAFFREEPRLAGFEKQWVELQVFLRQEDFEEKSWQALLADPRVLSLVRELDLSLQGAWLEDELEEIQKEFSSAEPYGTLSKSEREVLKTASEEQLADEFAKNYWQHERLNYLAFGGDILSFEASLGRSLLFTGAFFALRPFRGQLGPRFFLSRSSWLEILKPLKPSGLSATRLNSLLLEKSFSQVRKQLASYSKSSEFRKIFYQARRQLLAVERLKTKLSHKSPLTALSFEAWHGEQIRANAAHLHAGRFCQSGLKALMNPPAQVSKVAKKELKQSLPGGSNFGPRLWQRLTFQKHRFATRVGKMAPSFPPLELSERLARILSNIALYSGLSSWLTDFYQVGLRQFVEGTPEFRPEEWQDATGPGLWNQMQQELPSEESVRALVVESLLDRDLQRRVQSLNEKRRAQGAQPLEVLLFSDAIRLRKIDAAVEGKSVLVGQGPQYVYAILRRRPWSHAGLQYDHLAEEKSLETALVLRYEFEVSEAAAFFIFESAINLEKANQSRSLQSKRAEVFTPLGLNIEVLDQLFRRGELRSF